MQIDKQFMHDDMLTMAETAPSSCLLAYLLLPFSLSPFLPLLLAVVRTQ